MCIAVGVWSVHAPPRDGSIAAAREHAKSVGIYVCVLHFHSS